jgi:hypothetical protein
MKRVGPVILLALAGWPQLAHAVGSQQGQSVLNRWKVMDNCAKAAQLAFPDFTAEANAKRDAKYKQCLAGANLPPGVPLSPPAPPAGQ